MWKSLSKKKSNLTVRSKMGYLHKYKNRIRRNFAMDMNYTLELIDEAKILLELYRDMLSPFSLDDNDRKSVHYHVVIEETDELVDIYPGEEEGTFVVLHEAHLVQEAYGYVAGSGIEEMDESAAVCITFIIRRKGTAFIQEFFCDEEGNIDFEKTIQLSDE